MKPITTTLYSVHFSVRRTARLLLLAPCIFLTACLTVPTIQNSAGQSSMTVDSSRQGPVSGIGMEKSDIVSMTDAMVRDMLGNVRLANLIAKLPDSPVVILEGVDFENRSSQVIDKNDMANRLRVNLNRAGNGRLEFVARSKSARIDQERALKRAGVTTTGNGGLTKAVDGVNFIMVGEITASEARSTKSGLTQRSTQITFELVDAETTRIVWSGLYEFTRAAADDVVYR